MSELLHLHSGDNNSTRLVGLSQRSSGFMHRMALQYRPACGDSGYVFSRDHHQPFLIVAYLGVEISFFSVISHIHTKLAHNTFI